MYPSILHQSIYNHQSGEDEDKFHSIDCSFHFANCNHQRTRSCPIRRFQENRQAEEEKKRRLNAINEVSEREKKQERFLDEMEQFRKYRDDK